MAKMYDDAHKRKFLRPQNTHNSNEETVVEGLVENVVDLTELGMDVDDVLDKIYAEFGDDEPQDESWVGVYRMSINSTKLLWLFNCFAADFPIKARVRDEYGSGSYQARVYHKKGLLRRLYFDIEESRHNTGSKSQQSDIQALLKALVESQQKQMAETQAMFARLMEARNNAPAPIDAQQSMMGMLGMMVQMKQFLTPERAPDNGNQFDMFVKGIEIAKELGGSGNGESGVMDVIRDLIKSPLLGEAIKMSALTDATTPARTGDAALMRAAPQNLLPGQPKNQDHTAMNPQDFLLKQALGILIDAAAKSKDTDIYAELVLDTLNEEQLHRLLVEPDMVLALAQVAPAVTQHRAWFMALRQSMIEMLKPDESDHQQEANQ